VPLDPSREALAHALSRDVDLVANGEHLGRVELRPDLESLWNLLELELREVPQWRAPVLL